MVVNHNISSLIGGVSQQPQELRFDNQVETMENFQITTAEGLRRRNPIEFVADLGVTHSDSMAIHSYDRGDGLEKYGMIFDDNGLRIYDTDGVAKTVTITGTNPLTEWATGSDDWKKKIRFLTVGDTTWILNKDMVVESTINSDNVYAQKAFYWVKRSYEIRYGNNGEESSGYDYEVVLDGISYRINGTDTLTIATDLATAINSDLTSRFFAQVSTSIIRIVKGDYTSIAEGTYVSIISDDTNANSIAIADDASGTNTEYFNMKNNNSIIAAMIKASNGGYLATGTTATTTWLRIADMNTFASSYGDTGYYANIQYFNDINLGYGRYATVSIQEYNNDHSFTFASGDSYGNQASHGWRDNVQKIEDLPSDMGSFTKDEVGTIAVTGTDRDNFTSYYLEWDDSDGDGYWSETYLPNTSIKLTVETMPAKVVRQANGTFIFGFNIIDDTVDGFSETWSDRLKGDEDSNPKPSFIDNTITNMFFFKNRLCFTSEENVIMSETGGYYNFFATTVMDILDNDPIDASVDSNTVAVIRNINVSGGAATLWADDAQFLLAGGDILSPATTRISQTSSYACDNSISPLVVDNEIIFFNKLGSYMEVMSYAPATLQADNSSAESISSHVPKYLPSSISTAVVSSADNMMFLFSEDEANVLYVYKYFIKGQNKVVSAWSKWTFNITIRNINILGNTLFILANTNSLYKLELEPIPLDSVFLDNGIDAYTSNVVLSRLSAPSASNSKSQNIKDKFFLKNVLVNYDGEINLDIINNERGTTKTIPNKMLDRRQFISGHSDKMQIGFSTSSSNGCQINAINYEGRIQTKSRSF